MTLETDTFRIESTVCAQVVNDWTVIDWCKYDAVSGVGSYTSRQIINIEDDTKPTVESTDKLRFDVNADCISKGISLSAVGRDPGSCASPWLNWEVQVDLNSDWDIEYTYSTNVPAIINGCLLYTSPSPRDRG